MFTKKAFWGIGAAIALFPGIAFSDGRADRLNDGIDSSNGIVHTHSLSIDSQRYQMPRGSGESRAERQRIEQENAETIIDHTHRLHGDTAAGPGSQQSVRHTHRSHLHTYSGVTYPEGMTAYQRKRWQFDSDQR
jgi:hypothetical protein